jgi:hypothetical protein
MMLNLRQILAFAPWRDVRFGSKADICSAKSHVRFTPESGHVQCNLGCPLWAKSGHHCTFITVGGCHVCFMIGSPGT